MSDLWEEAASQRDRLLAWARSMTRDEGMAEEAVQDTLFKAWLKGCSVRCHAVRWSWLYAVLRNSIRSSARARMWRDHLGLVPLVEEPVSPEANDSRSFDESLTENMLRIECLMTLRPAYREVLEVVYVNDVPVSEFARTRGITKNNAKMRLRRARRALRRELEKPRGPGTRPQPTAKDSPRCPTTPRGSDS